MLFFVCFFGGFFKGCGSPVDGYFLKLVSVLYYNMLCFFYNILVHPGGIVSTGFTISPI